MQAQQNDHCTLKLCRFRPRQLSIVSVQTWLKISRRGNRKYCGHQRNRPVSSDFQTRVNNVGANRQRDNVTVVLLFICFIFFVFFLCCRGSRQNHILFCSFPASVEIQSGPKTAQS